MNYLQKVKKNEDGKVIEFTIPRKRWYRGKGHSNSALLVTNTDKMCCLGVYSRACGAKAKDIEGIQSPAALKKSGNLPLQMAWLVFDPYNDLDTLCNSSTYCSNLMSINDNEEVTDEIREQHIISLFKDKGIKVNFE